MKIINIGILAHVDAGKTTLTESLLYTSGAITEQGSVDKGTTRTDTMILERQRGITIQTAVTSFCWNGYKINIVDTPGHMDFLAEVYRSLSVLDGAILVVSAKDGVQAQTRILFHALQKMNIPTIIFVNKIDQNGIDLRRIYQNIREKLTSDMIVMQEVVLSSKITMTDISDLDKWDTVIAGSDELLERYIAEGSLDMQELQREKCRRTRCCSLFPVYHGSAKDNLGMEKLIEVITETFVPETENSQSELCGYVFKIEYTDRKKRLSYLRLYHGTLHLRDTIQLSKKKRIKITEMFIPSNGEIVPADYACSGEIVILSDDTLKLNDILGNEKLLPRRAWIDNPMPLLRTSVESQKSEQREALLNALIEIADTDPLLHFEIDTVTHEIILSFLGKVQLEVICSLLEEKYHVRVAMKEPTVIYLERPIKKATYTIHIEVPPNPFWASIGLTVTPLPAGSGNRFKSKVSLGYLNQSFQNAVMEGVRYGMEQGLYGWKVTDCEICFDYGVYYSPVSTPADFRFLAPIVLEQALKRAGTQLLEPYLSFTIFAPQEYLSRAYNDAPKYCAVIESTLLKNDEAIFTGEIPARCIGEYRNDLNFYTNGRSVCLTELKGYQETSGEPVLQPRRPNSRLDKVRHMFQKIT
ncbi:TetM/TetW/TetO/TetS family tetracycline resistance ribosomal protection protein [Clostridioides difficile]|uniref:TetM/TetW/TetO/TetS family tetracycline resistance ribosomal protection protein n=1 Tax=Clostridioides difficile TaxID=1496 RepID=UPI001C2937F5|nr:TetM/TetW/TetO/TetS family tetracycline resistance ribosomal protection protein [Clostridioides difficile]QXF92975.1 TetM/TetW/TetO/TetS family tetracycline resistance ribosomal protection protein [Clostridioides difficile]HBH3482942.1 TetM/TetW/TetO/TetS family tetracycline resistance ribosomal protection protein [Clostridioides difficile]HBH3483937.1 TetM/TetW/TetO/TetS family tetracycline resistance ribosomal protection protein [Clostridioides difficile]